MSQGGTGTNGSVDLDRRQETCLLQFITDVLLVLFLSLCALARGRPALHQSSYRALEHD